MLLSFYKVTRVQKRMFYDNVMSLSGTSDNIKAHEFTIIQDTMRHTLCKID